MINQHDALSTKTCVIKSTAYLPQKCCWKGGFGGAFSTLYWLWERHDIITISLVYVLGLTTLRILMAATTSGGAGIGFSIDVMWRSIILLQFTSNLHQLTPLEIGTGLVMSNQQGPLIFLSRSKISKKLELEPKIFENVRGVFRNEDISIFGSVACKKQDKNVIGQK